MRHSNRRWIGRAAICAVALTCLRVDRAYAADDGPTQGPPSRASGESMAPELSEQGLAFYKARDYRRATEKFLQAYAIDPDPNLLFNVARCYQALGDLVAAIEKYEAYLRSPNIDATGRERAEKWLRTLREAVDSKSGSAARPAEKALAHDTAPRSPREPVVHADRDPARAATEISNVESKSSRDAVAMTVGWVATGTLAAATAVVGIVAIDSSNQLSAARAVFPGDAARIDELASRTTVLGTTADVLGVATVVAAGLSLYWTVARPSPRGEMKAGLGMSGIRFTGSF